MFLIMACLRLAIEPIPASSRLASLAKMLPPAQWDAVRRSAYRQARFRCQVCGREARLHCHEVWQYAEQTGRQWLAGLLALCPDCHDVKHITTPRDGAAQARLLEHFAAVNRIPRAEAEGHFRAAIHRQRWLDHRHWVVDYGAYNSSVPCLRDAEHRRAFLSSSGRCGFAAPRSQTPISAHGDHWRDDPDY